MTSDRRQRVRDLFDRASQLGAQERSAFLGRECAADPELLAEVEELLSFDRPTAEIPVPPIFDRLEDEPVPERIGPYVLGEALGEGGFGEVYAARQLEPFERDVALKLMKSGRVTHELMARFEGERQALALLDHPGIAKIFDAGTTEGGRLYFVMERVDGQSITRHCDEERLALGQRLELFTQVCRAVEHAHRRGIIHRDIKPSNVLVARTDAGPVPKVIDFGVAKAGGHALSRETLVTQRGQLIGTPEYMSPEQADFGGLDVDTRTDVYALGVLLYELLCGALPFEPDRLRSGSFSEALRIIREEEPPRPSARLVTSPGGAEDVARRRGTTARRLRQGLQRELDWIVLKALEKDRDRRYESASALALDIERYRRHEAVLAGPPSVAYRLTKFARRHRVALVVGLSLFIATVVSAVESNRRRAVAEAARRESEAVSEFLSETLGAANPLKDGRDVTVAELLERATEAGLERFDGQPLVRARLSHTIGEVYTRLGMLAEAREQLERALELRRDALGEDAGPVGDTHNMLGVLFKTTGEYEDSLHHYRRALEIYREREGPRSVGVAQQLNNIGAVHSSMLRYDEALEDYEEALSIREEAFGPEHITVAHTLTNLGGLYQRRSQHELSLPLYRRALAILETSLGPDHAELVPLLNNLGSTLDILGQPEEAAQVLRRSLSIGEATLGPDHPDLGVALLNLAILVKNTEGPEAAYPLYRRTIDIWEETLGPTHPHTESAYISLALLHGETDDYAGAEPLLERAAASREERLGADHRAMAYPLYYLGLTRRELGQLESAREILERCLRLEEAADPSSMDTAATLEGLMLVARDQGRAEDQERYRERMQAIVDTQGEDD